MASGGIRSNEKSSDIGNRTLYLPACNIVPQPTTLPRAPPEQCLNCILNGKLVSQFDFLYIISRSLKSKERTPLVAIT
jgi:hypothetical protein